MYTHAANAGVDTIRTIVVALTDVLGRAPSSAALLDRYTRLALVVDEVRSLLYVLLLYAQTSERLLFSQPILAHLW